MALSSLWTVLTALTTREIILIIVVWCLAGAIIILIRNLAKLRSNYRELRDAEESFRQLVQESRDFAICLLDPQGRVRSWNEGAERIEGYKAEEIIGKSISLFYPDEDVRAGRPQQNLLRAAEEGRIEDEGWRVRKDGSRFWTNAVLTALLDNRGRLLGFSKITRDTSERREIEQALRRSEARFRRLAESNIIGLGLGDSEGSIVEANEAFLKMIGATREALASGDLRWAAITAPEYILRHQQAMEQMKAAGFVHPYETELSRTDGGRVPVLAGAALLEEPRDSFIFWVLDVTPQKEATDALRKTKEGLESRVRERTQSLIKLNEDLKAEIHDRERAQLELRESLDQLRVLTARMEKVREEERARIAREVHDGLGQSLTAIKMDLFFLLRSIPQHEIPARTRLTSTTKLVDETIQLVRKIARQLRPGLLDDLGLGAALEWEAEEFYKRTGIPCRVRTPDADLTLDDAYSITLFRIFQEALTNVARHSGATSVDVKLSKDAERVTLEVSDNGRGIPQAVAAQGRSLGLVGMRERAQLLKGEFRIKSESGGGTTVIVSLPLNAKPGSAAIQ